MTAIAIPRPRRRRSRRARLLKSAGKVWASLQIGSAAAKTAKRGAKAGSKTAKKGATTGAKTWATVKTVKLTGRGGKKLLIIPLAAAGGGVAAWKLRSGSSESEPEPATPYGSSVGPAATPATVTPPKTAPGSAPDLDRDGEMSDPPAGASNPPVPPGSTS
jgi:hypothetical protein